MKINRITRIYNYFKKISILRKLVRLIPVFNHILFEKDKINAEKKILEVERDKYKEWANFLLRRKEIDKEHKIATIINYCTTDYKFIKHCIDEVKKISSQIIVPVSDFFFDGTPENKELLEKTYEENKGVDFIKFEYKPNIDRSIYWHNFSRWIGFTVVREDIEYVLFLDADEIVEGDRIKNWLNNFNYKNYNAIYFASYFYFREIKFRSLTNEVQGLLVRKNFLNKNTIMNVIYERGGIYNKIPEKKISKVGGIDDEPMIHHYSWVRTKEEMLKKVKTWGHRKDRDWITSVEKEFLREFSENCIDFVHGYRYKVVKPYIEINPNSL